MARTTRAAARCSLLVLAALIIPSASRHDIGGEQLEGRAPTAEELQPSVEAAFGRESYAPGETAKLVLFGAARRVSVQFFRSGPERQPTVGNNELEGVPVTVPWRVGRTRAGEVVSIRLGGWPSGLYFARLRASDGRVGFAPFVLRPRHLGQADVAVVLPTMTWQAYNLRDDDDDGKGDSWYAEWTHLTVRLARPFLDRGVPYNFRRYDLPFLHWLAWNGHQVDVLSDADLERTTGQALAHAYRLIAFPGHHEYVTTREYDAVERYRDLGGHLMFLSANDFFWRVLKRGNVIEKTQQWRDLGRPEAALIGVQYRGNDRGTHRAPWVMRNVEAAPWLFAGTGLTDGASLGNAGIEIDETSGASPKNVRVLADIRNLFGPGFTAQMTYYETPRGAEVFAAGAFTLAGSALQPMVSRLLENLWEHLAGRATA
jgi:N,N-dimethylformamidase beta subunit-like, C-terminal